MSPRTLAERIRQGTRRLRPFIDRRATGRRKRAHEIFSNLGTVVNLSPGGVRIRSIRRLHGTQTFELWARNVRVKVRAEIAWTRKTGFRRHEIGMRFVDLTTDDVRALTELAK